MVRVDMVPISRFEADSERLDDWPFETLPDSVPEPSVSDRFERVARIYRKHLAIDDGRLALTYGELAEIAHAIAATIEAAIHDRPGPIAVFLGHETRFPAAILGVLATTRVCVPLDCDAPAERNRSIATHATAAAVVSAGRLAVRARSVFGDLPIIDIEALTSPQSRADFSTARSDDTAVILYTSGSTGAPKGVYQNHRGVLHDVLEAINRQRISSEDRLSLFHSPTVISGFRIALSALLAGAQLHILSPQELSGIKLVRELHKRRITIFRGVPALFRHVVESLERNERLDTIRLVILGGDCVDCSDFDAFQRSCPPNAKFGVHLGATECWTLYLDWFVDERPHSTNGKLPVGRVIDGRTVKLVGEGGQIVADGELGEFVVSGRHLALGYWRDPELTACAFSTCGLDPEERTYHTGDLGVRRSDGLFEYVGRKDQQIKLHGNRIELAEVEIALRNCNDVADAAVLVRKNEANVPQSLVAYVEPQPSACDLTPVALTSMLEERLPSHMVPAIMVLVEQLPRLPHLKIDRMRLAEMDAVRGAQIADPIDDPLINEVAKIFKLVLGVGGATPEDNVASLGGDSLQAVRIAIELEKHFDVSISPELFNGSKSINVLARWISLQRAKQTSTARSAIPSLSVPASRSSLDRVPRDAPSPLCLLQEPFWVSPQAHQTVAGCERILGPLNVDVLRECITFLAGRHEMLRTSFAIVDGQPMQTVHALEPVPLAYIDFADLADAEQQALLLFDREARTVFDLMQRPLLRLTLARIRADEHWLIRVCHHILFDGFSWDLYFGELALLYEAKLQGEPAPLLEREPLQYLDYAAWLRHAPREPTYQQRIKWWQNQFEQISPAPELPFRRAEQLEGLDPDEGSVQLAIEPSASQGLAELARQQRATYFTVVLAAYVASLSAEAIDAPVVLHSFVSTRNRAELQNIFGVLINLVPIILRCESYRTFREWVSKVRDHMLEIDTNSVPYGQLVREMHGRNVRVPEIGRLINGRPPRSVHRCGQLEISGLAMPRLARMPSGFLLTVGEIWEAITLSFDASLFDTARVRTLISRSSRFLNVASQNPDLAIDRLFEL